MPGDEDFMTSPDRDLPGSGTVRQFWPEAAGRPANARPMPCLAPRSRARLRDLPLNFHCSIVGTCLNLTEARKFAARHALDGACDSSDLEIHETMVRIASDAGAGGRELNKHLDRRYDLAIRNFDKAKSEPALVELWTRALAEGDIPGAYWAALTHRLATPDFRSKVFGEVHMLSHLIGAANRAGVRRLTDLERENSELKEKSDRQQMRLRDLVMSRDAVISGLEKRLASLLASDDDSASRPKDYTGESETLAGLVATLSRQLERKAARAETLAEQVIQLQTALKAAESALAQSQVISASMADELAVLDMRLAGGKDGTEGIQRQLGALLRDRTVFYCGGRRGHIEAIRRLVEANSGTFVHHDGGLEERKGLMASLMQGADIAFSRSIASVTTQWGCSNASAARRANHIAHCAPAAWAVLLSGCANRRR